MRLFVASDIHGSATALKTLLDAFASSGAEYLVLCGDYLNHGPRNPIPEGYDPKAVALALNGIKSKIIGVRGNCDSEVDQMLLEFPCMGDYSTVLFDNRRIFVTHGHIFGKDRLPPLSAGDVFVSGHTHVPVLETRDGIIFLNPGSASIPKESSEGGYALIDDSGISLMTLSGKELKRHDW
ncbi:MAG TPA: phosphodiesterase [Treponemataceae bacterium]|nr:phosphodiesterase [Treponemataceae bacterium]